jgi:subtilisin family serine protease/putative cell wall-binding protein
MRRQRSRGATRRRTSLVALVALAVTSIVANPSVVATGDTPASEPVITAAHDPSAVLVQFDPAYTDRTLRTLTALWGDFERQPVTSGDELVERLVLPSDLTVSKALATLSDIPGVLVAEPEFIVTKTVVSNDPYVLDGSLWGVAGPSTTPSNSFGSAAAAAWAAGVTGSASVFVGVIDEGIQVTHPDLAANMWVNPFEIPGDGIDNDGNGYVDDVHGWDFNGNDNSVFDGAEGSNKDSHGTHVAGTIGAVGGNGVGVAGVNWDVTMISLKVLGDNGGSTADVIRAIDYLTDLKLRHGLNVVASSNSYGCSGCYSRLMLEAIERGGDAGILFVAAAGNSADDTGVTPHYPSSYQCDRGGTRGWNCVLSVASMTSNGSLSWFSNYGDDVHLGAPGSGIWSTVPIDSYANFSGTSMATPHVSGAIALCASVDPTLSAHELRDLVLATVVATPSLQGKVATGGRLDAATLVTACGAVDQPLTGALTGLIATALGPRELQLAWTNGTTGLSVVDIDLAPQADGGCTATPERRVVPAAPTTTFVGGLNPDTTYCARVRARQIGGATTTDWTPWVTVRTTPPPVQMTCTASEMTWRDIAASGTLHTLTDDGRVQVDLPFPFGVGNTPSNTAWISSNGVVSFVSSTPASWYPTTIPDATDPDGFVAPWWADLNPAAGGSVRSATLGSAPNREFVVSWLDVPHFGRTATVTLQVVLREGGEAVFNYLDVTTGDDSTNGRRAVIGIEDDTGQFGTLLSAFTATINDGDAYLCATPDPSTVELTTVIPSLGSALGGDAVTLTGSWGDATISGVNVDFTCASGSRQATVSAVTSSTIEVTSPACDTAGVVAVTVTAPGGSASLAGAYTYRLPPTITNVSPASGPATGGTVVTVAGTNFVAGATSANLRGLEVTNLTVIDDTTLAFTTPSVVPLGAAGSADLLISVGSGGKASLAGAFTYNTLLAAVSVTTPDTQTLGTGPLTLVATAPTALQITSLTPGLCSVNGLVVTLIASGRCQIELRSAGTALYGSDVTTVAFTIVNPVATSPDPTPSPSPGPSPGPSPSPSPTPEPGEPVVQSFRPTTNGVVAARLELAVGPLALNLVGAKSAGEVVVTPYDGKPAGTGRGVVLPGGFVDIEATVDFDIAEVCVPFDPRVMTAAGANVDELRLFHFTDHAEDITTRVDRAARQVCGLTIGFSPFGVGTLDTERLAGSNRYDTAVEISRAAFRPGVPVAFIASGEGFADALAAGAAAGTLGGPVLLTARTTLPTTVRSELVRLRPRQVIVVGGTSVVTAPVMAAIEQAVPTAAVERLPGADRYDTAAAIAQFAHPGGTDVVYLATGRSAPDALAGGAAAVRDGAPVLLVPGVAGSLPPTVTAALARLAPRQVVVLGGRAAVDAGTVAAVERLLPGVSVRRVAGNNRYETAARAVATFTTVDHVYVAIGSQFPDALAATAVAGFQGVPVLLVDPSGIPDSTHQVLRRLAPQRIVVLGGVAAISRGIESRLAGYLPN